MLLRVDRRYRDRNRRAGPLLALECNRAAVQVYRLLDNRQAQSGAGYSFGIAGAVESLEQLLLIFLRDADALILHTEAGVLWLAVHRKRNRVGFQRIFQCIRKQIAQNVVQQLGIQPVVLGPGNIEQAHQPDEYIAINRLQPMMDLLGQTVKSVCT